MTIPEMEKPLGNWVGKGVQSDLSTDCGLASAGYQCPYPGAAVRQEADGSAPSPPHVEL